jgi:hypothetical protein
VPGGSRRLRVDPLDRIHPPQDARSRRSLTLDALEPRARPEVRAIGIESLAGERLMGLEPTTFCMAIVCDFRITAG